MAKSIYELRMFDGGQWIPFYVGQTSDPKKRIVSHRSSSKTGVENKYQLIRQLDSENIKWDLFVVKEYDEDEVGSYENDRILELLRNGILLTNMKKGSPNWIEQRQAIADDMNRRGLPSGTTEKQYRAIVTQEALDAKHAAWIREQEAAARIKLKREEWERSRAEAAIRAEQQRRVKAEQEQALKLSKILEVQHYRMLWQSLPKSVQYDILKTKEIQDIFDTYRTESNALKVMYLRRILHYYIPINDETAEWHIDVAQSVKSSTKEIDILRWSMTKW
jgi:hypothetical protein